MILAGLALTAMLWGGTANADLAKPKGQVVLTIGGAVSESNLDASQFYAASFLKSLEYGYDKAAGFDIAMLEALGTVKKTIKAEPWPAAVTFEGPRLSDVLAAAGGKATEEVESHWPWAVLFIKAE